MKNKRKKSIRSLFRLYILLCLSLFVSAELGGQATFAWPTQDTGMSRFQTVDNCLNEINLLAQRSQDGGNDTVQWVFRPYINSQAAEVTAFAKKCSAQFSLESLMKGDSLSISTMLKAHSLFLVAARDDEAAELVRLWIASIPQELDTVVTLTKKAVFNAALNIKPVRFDLAWSQLDQLRSPDVDSQAYLFERISMVASISHVAGKINDSVNANISGRWLIDNVAALHDSLVNSRAYQSSLGGIGIVVRDAIFYLRSRELMDSLAESTESYARYRQILSDSSRMIAPPKDLVISPLKAEFWFSDENTTQPKPRNGRISVIYTTKDNECYRCLVDLAIIKRLESDFPEVEVTILANTKGYYGMVIEPPSPAEEANLIDSVYRRYSTLPITVAVSQTPFWRLPVPDRRRVNSQVANEDQFPDDNPSPTFTVIDRNRRFIASFSSTRYYALMGQFEEDLRKVLSSLLRQSNR